MIQRFSLLCCALALAAACGKSTPKAPAVATLPGMAGVTPPTITGNDPRAALFLQKGCPNCHSITALGIKSGTDAGPDLTFAYADVQSRFGVKLEEFLPNPTGTMQMVLSSMIKLSPEERDSVIHILKRLHDEQSVPAPDHH
ncbi:MAG TPA: hypothetical protein VI139_09505 [Gemmatimonadales bacterium]